LELNRDIQRMAMANLKAVGLHSSIRISVKEVGLAAKRRHAVDNGGIDARLLEFDLY
jgi:hypothetical protein